MPESQPQGEACAYCRFWWPFTERAVATAGLCRRRAPVVGPQKVAARYPTAGVYPKTMRVGWCGEFEPFDGRIIEPEVLDIP